MISQTIQFHLKRNLKDATKKYPHLINQENNDYRLFANLEVLLKDLGKLQEAELSLSKTEKLD